MESEAVFGAVVRLLGYDLHQTASPLEGGLRGVVVVTLHWQAIRRMDVPYKFFVHLVDPRTEELVAQADVMPYDWIYPTLWWETGEVVSDGIAVSLAGVPSGVYRLEIGVYDPDSGIRLPLTSGREPQQPPDRLTLSEAMEVH